MATQPVDFRKGHDGLAALVQSVLKENPFTGTVFVFRAKRVNGGEKVGHVAAQNQASGAAPSAMARALVT